MFQYIYNEDIAKSNADVIVNASNGIGWMGGKDGIKVKKRGLAESLHYESKGKIEKLAKKYCKEHSVFGFSSGHLFITDAPNLKARKIYHAVTMWLPGSKAKKEKIEPLVDKILETLDRETEKIQTVALSFLGCGTGRIDKEFVREIYERKFKDRPEIFLIYEQTKIKNQENDRRTQ